MRYIGIDTPESVKPGLARRVLREAARAPSTSGSSAGERVRLVRDVEERDRYGRLLAYVYRARDGLFVNAELVRRGYATVATFPPNVAHERDFRRLAEARPFVRTRTLVGVRGCGLSDRSARDRRW